jgi:hypothetical protein
MKQSTTLDGKLGWVQTKVNVWSEDGSKFIKGIYPKADKFEVGGSRIILPNGQTAFLFYSEIEKSFYE